MNDKTPPSTSQQIEAWKLAIKLLIGSLSIFFVAGIMGYVVIRFQHVQIRYEESFSVPVPLWISTIALLFTSYALQKTLRTIKLEQASQAKSAIKLSWIGTFLFCGLQIVGMAQILQAYGEQVSLNGIAFSLMVMHALHVLAGVVWLGVATHCIYKNRYDHEYHLGLTLCTYYWHFLDFIWIVMFLVFLST